jgi:flagellar biosynthesis component FlhA
MSSAGESVVGKYANDRKALEDRLIQPGNPEVSEATYVTCAAMIGLGYVFGSGLLAIVGLGALVARVIVESQHDLRQRAAAQSSKNQHDSNNQQP